MVFQIDFKSPTSKILNINFLMSKFSKFCQEVDNFKRKNFPWGKRFIFPTKFELKIQEAKQG
jgi:hypothetical protein